MDYMGVLRCTKCGQINDDFVPIYSPINTNSNLYYYLPNIEIYLKEDNKNEN